MARSFLIISLEQAGRFEEAVAESKIEAAQLGRSPDQAQARARAYRGGRTHRVLEGMRAATAGRSGSRTRLRPGHLDLREARGQGQSVCAAQSRYEQRNMWLMNLRADPRFDDLR